MLDKKEFLKEIVTYLYGKVEGTIVAEDNIFSVKLHKTKTGSCTCYLGNFYGHYINGESLEVVKKMILKNIEMKEFEGHAELKFEEMKHRIYPTFRLKNKINEMMIFEDFIEDLCMVFVVDYQDSIAFITKDDIKRWGKTINEISDIARYNLFSFKDTCDLEKVSTDEDTLHYINSFDGYDASRILLSHKFKGEWIVGIPNRDFLFAIKYSEKPIDIVPFIQLVVKYYKKEPYSITPKLFLYEDGKLRGWAREGILN